MTPEEFRRHGYAMIDWLTGYMERVGDLPVQSRLAPGEIRDMLPDHAPEDPEDFEEIAADLDRIVVPGLTNWVSPGWFAFFPAATSGPGILGELVSAGLGQQGMLWATSPVCTELENVMADWMADLLGLPARWNTWAAFQTYSTMWMMSGIAVASTPYAATPLPRGRAASRRC